MKMYKNKSWQLAVIGVEGKTELFGVNIFDQEWVDTNERIKTADLPCLIPVYQITIDRVQHQFAATEQSNGIWRFYIYQY